MRQRARERGMVDRPAADDVEGSVGIDADRVPGLYLEVRQVGGGI